MSFTKPVLQIVCPYESSAKTIPELEIREAYIKYKELRRLRNMIDVKRKNNNEFIVMIEEDSSRTNHVVTLDDEYYEKLTQGKITKEELIRRSFQFLLKREAKEAILSRFNLKVINRYFPEYEAEIKP